MAIVTFWSNSNKQMGQTLAIMATATYIGEDRKYNAKTLLMSSNAGDTSFEEAFSTKASSRRKSMLAEFGMDRKVGLDSGMDGLTKFVNSGKNTDNMITNFSQVALKNRLEVLFPTKRVETPDGPETAALYKTIISNANRFYDYVFIDLEKGLNKEYIRTVLEMSDVIVVGLEQRKKEIENFIEFKKKEKLFKKNNSLILLGRYDRFSKYNVKNVVRQIGIKDPIFCMPYNTLLYEAVDENTITDLFWNIRKADETDRNGIFLKEVKRLTEGIMYKIQEIQMNF